MKLLSLFFLSVFSITSCGNTHHLKSKKKTTIKTVENKKQATSISVEYSALSRGTYKLIKIDETTISTGTKRDSKLKTTPCDKTVWKNISSTIKNIDIEKISNIKAPSKKFLFDGAAIARLKITSNGKTYETPPFDHGNPPEEIAALVKEMLSISQNIE